MKSLYILPLVMQNCITNPVPQNKSGHTREDQPPPEMSPYDHHGPLKLAKSLLPGGRTAFSPQSVRPCFSIVSVPLPLLVHTMFSSTDALHASPSCRHAPLHVLVIRPRTGWWRGGQGRASRHGGGHGRKGEGMFLSSSQELVGGGEDERRDGA
jgi:hypothetical protein